MNFLYVHRCITATKSGGGVDFDTLWSIDRENPGDMLVRQILQKATWFNHLLAEPEDGTTPVSQGSRSFLFLQSPGLDAETHRGTQKPQSRADPGMSPDAAVLGTKACP